MIALGRAVLVGLWILANVAFMVLVSLDLEVGSEWVVLFVVVGTPAYVGVVHWADLKYRLLGINSMRAPLGYDAGLSSVRRELQVEMLAICSGFAATLFILSIQLWVEFKARLPELVPQVMAFLFFFASAMNLVQLVLHRVAISIPNKLPTEAKGKLKKELDRHIRRTLQWLQGIAWHALLTPGILAFSIISVQWCIAVNLIYGLLLYTYYFLDNSDNLVGLLNKAKAAPPALDTSPPGD